MAKSLSLNCHTPVTERNSDGEKKRGGRLSRQKYQEVEPPCPFFFSFLFLAATSAVSRERKPSPLLEALRRFAVARFRFRWLCSGFALAWSWLCFGFGLAQVFAGPGPCTARPRPITIVEYLITTSIPELVFFFLNNHCYISTLVLSYQLLHLYYLDYLSVTLL